MITLQHRLLRTILFAFILAMVFFFLGMALFACATVKPFPSENIVISAPTPYGKLYIRILKGNLDEEHKGEWWMTEEEFIRLRAKGKIPELLDQEI